MQKALLISLLHVSKQNPNFLMDASKCLITDSVSEYLSITQYNWYFFRACVHFFSKFLLGTNIHMKRKHDC